MTTSPSGDHTYYPGLDSLRTIAILLVIFSHWLPYDNIINSFVPNGPMGVVLFFVLSGYLITGILLHEKEQHQLGRKSYGKILKSFYLKRSLRIFPIYYITLGVMLLMGIPDVREFFWWHFGYASNFLFYLKKSWMSEYVSPLWSLSVEEQFYIFWPFLILFSNRKLVLVWLFICLFTGTALRMLPVNLDVHPYSFAQFLTPYCIDCFAVGGLIAYVRRYCPEKLMILKRVFLVIALAGITYLFFIIPSYGHIHFINVVFNRNIYSSFAAVYIIFVITQPEKKNWLAQDLEHGLPVYIGKISYSMYLWHNLIPYFESVESAHQRFFIRLALLIVLSSISYFLLERPLLSLKKYIS
jgi:peptidoglycan/LPS O-acetylase OafA/YrhL